MGFINQCSTIIDLNSPWQEGYQISVKNLSFYDPFPKRNQYWSFWCHGWFKHQSSFNFNFTLKLVIFPSSYGFFNFQFLDNFWQDRPMCYVVSLPQFSQGGASINSNFFDHSFVSPRGFKKNHWGLGTALTQKPHWNLFIFLYFKSKKKPHFVVVVSCLSKRISKRGVLKIY